MAAVGVGGQQFHEASEGDGHDGPCRGGLEQQQARVPVPQHEEVLQRVGTHLVVVVEGGLQHEVHGRPALERTQPAITGVPGRREREFAVGP
jgi:hypothetical protein